MKLLVITFLGFCSSWPIHEIVSPNSKLIEDWTNVKQRIAAPKTHQSQIPAFTSNHLKYHLGNPVLTDPVDIFCNLFVLRQDIFYGNWQKYEKDVHVLENLAKHIGNTSWYGIMKDYYYQESVDTEKVYVSGVVNFVKSVYDHYSFGKRLENENVLQIIQNQIDLGAIPEKYSALYFVLTSSDVDEVFQEEILGRDYCGYHYTGILKSTQKIFYSVVGHPARFKGCIDSITNSTPNGPAIDSMASTIAHELVEAVSDPDDDDNRSWEDSEFMENGDKCSVNTFFETYNSIVMGKHQDIMVLYII